jgi:hypothetical protein
MRDELPEQVELFGTQLRMELRKAGDVPARSGEAYDITGSNRITVNDEHDGNIPVEVQGCLRLSGIRS